MGYFNYFYDEKTKKTVSVVSDKFGHCYTGSAKPCKEDFDNADRITGGALADNKALARMAKGIARDKQNECDLLEAVKTALLQCNALQGRKQREKIDNVFNVFLDKRHDEIRDINLVREEIQKAISNMSK